MTVTLPTTNFLKSSEITGFLVAQGLAVASGSDTPLPLATACDRDRPYPALPNRQYLVTGYGGVGFQAEQALDVQRFQIVSRGRPAIGVKASLAADDAEQIAWVADVVLTDTPAGAIGSQYVNLVTRAGGPPQFLERDPKGRVLYVCNYQFTVARTGR